MDSPLQGKKLIRSLSRPCGAVWKLCPMITFEGWTSGGPLGGWLVFAGRENAREDRGEALVSRVWIFTPRHDSHTFGANLRHRHRHTCHRHLRSSWWERHWVNENVMKIWKRWREGMINLINYPFYFGRRGKKSHAVSVHWYCLLWWQTALPPQTFHCHRHHYHHHHYW